MNRREFMSVLGGAAAPWPLAARAQQTGKVYRVALVHPAAPVAEMSQTGNLRFRAFFGELRRLGYVEGRNLIVERYSGEGRTEHYGELAHDVVRLKPDLIFAIGNVLTTHFKSATATIPIVSTTSDPVVAGFATSLAHPGSNITGVSVDAGLAIWGKRLALLKETIPALSRVGLSQYPRGLGKTSTISRGSARGSAAIGDFAFRRVA